MEATAEAASQLLPAMVPLHDALCCHICHGFYTGPVTLPCGHSYCSACIRSNLDFKAVQGEDLSCPDCRAKVDVAQLVPNYMLREAITAYGKALPSLMARLQPLPAPSAQQQQPARKRPRPQTWLQQQIPTTTADRQGVAHDKQHGRARQGAPPQHAGMQHTAEPQHEVMVLDASDESGRDGEQHSHPSSPARNAGHTDQMALPGQQYSDAERRHSTEESQHDSGDEEMDHMGDVPAAAVVSNQRQQGADAERGGPGASTSGTKRIRARVETVGSAAQTPAVPQPQPQAIPSPPPPEGCVRCPTCGVVVRSALINMHLDVCLSRQVAQLDKPHHKPVRQKVAPSNSRHQQHELQAAADGAVPEQLQQQQAPQQQQQGQQELVQPPPPQHTAPVGPRPRVGGSAVFQRRPPGPDRLSMVDLPPKLVFNVLKDKDLRAKMKQLGLPVDGTREEHMERYSAYRRYLQAKLDEGSSMQLPQARASFIAQYKQQAAARRVSPSLNGTVLSALTTNQMLTGGVVPGQGSRAAAGGHKAGGVTSRAGSPSPMVEVCDLLEQPDKEDADRQLQGRHSRGSTDASGVKAVAGGQAAAGHVAVPSVGGSSGSGSAFKQLIAELAARKGAAGQPAAAQQEDATHTGQHHNGAIQAVASHNGTIHPGQSHRGALGGDVGAGQQGQQVAGSSTVAPSCDQDLCCATLSVEPHERPTERSGKTLQDVAHLQGPLAQPCETSGQGMPEAATGGAVGEQHALQPAAADAVQIQQRQNAVLDAAAAESNHVCGPAVRQFRTDGPAVVYPNLSQWEGGLSAQGPTLQRHELPGQQLASVGMALDGHPHLLQPSPCNPPDWQQQQHLQQLQQRHYQQQQQQLLQQQQGHHQQHPQQLQQGHYQQHLRQLQQQAQCQQQEELHYSAEDAGHMSGLHHSAAPSNYRHGRVVDGGEGGPGRLRTPGSLAAPYLSVYEYHVDDGWEGPDGDLDAVNDHTME